MKALKLGDIYIVAYRRLGEEWRQYAVAASHATYYTSYDCLEVVEYLVDMLKRLGVAVEVELEPAVEEDDMYKSYRWEDKLVQLEPDEEVAEP